jgi:hypothetical protein
MDSFQSNTSLLPPPLRALALGLLVETGAPTLHQSREAGPATPSQTEGVAASRSELWQTLRDKCGELSTLVLRADDPHVAAVYVLGYFPKYLEYVLELVHGRKRSLEEIVQTVIQSDPAGQRWADGRAQAG